MVPGPRLAIILALVGAVAGTLLGWDGASPAPAPADTAVTTIKRPTIAVKPRTTATTMTAHSVPTLAPRRDKKRDKSRPTIENQGRGQDKKQDKVKDTALTTTSTTTSSTTTTSTTIVKETTTT